uniref:S-protein homolog n=1 Tax=Brassica oleracea TaxID=3712 RepID=A0A3P6G1G8_BRAOL|nr:unnamed protein product [Brassica oleracea]
MKNSPKLCVAFLIMVLLFGLSHELPPLWPRTHLTMTNNLGGPVLTVHCKSKDDDLGVHMVAAKTDYHFSFQPNIWKTTLFFCSFQWNDQVKQFDIFDAPRDQDDGYKFYWTIKPDSPCKLGTMQEMHRRGCPKSIIVLVRYDACDHLCLVLTGALEVEGSRRKQTLTSSYMASSSHINVDESLDDAFDELFDQHFEQAFEEFTIHGDQEERRKKTKKKRAYIERNREEGHNRLWNDYFSETPTYPENFFRRRFRMNKPLFMHIVDRLSNEVQYFRQKKDGLRRISLSPIQKCTEVIRVMAYGYAADTVDEYLRLSESTTRLCLEHFVEGIINLFGDEYLRRPTPTDLQRLLAWKNCPTAWKG